MATIGVDRAESSNSGADMPTVGFDDRYGGIEGDAVKDRFRNLAEQVFNQPNSGYRKIRVETLGFMRPPARSNSSLNGSWTVL